MSLFHDPKIYRSGTKGVIRSRYRSAPSPFVVATAPSLGSLRALTTTIAFPRCLSYFDAFRHFSSADFQVAYGLETQTVNESTQPEPWLRGTLTNISPVPRAVLHALELAKEDLTRWCAGLSDAELNARPFGIAPVAFHIRHTARSVDRLLTYAEGRNLNDEQLAALKSELAPNAGRDDLFAELEARLADCATRIAPIDPARLDEPRSVGKKQLPTTVAGLLVHIADHTQRHVGQAITTAKIVAASRT
jgi:uncharacterized damage-inducible protein DinB